MKSEFKKLTDENKFSRKFACWCNNHCGISKLKRANRQEARNKLKEKLKKEIEETTNEDDKWSIIKYNCNFKCSICNKNLKELCDELTNTND